MDYNTNPMPAPLTHYYALALQIRAGRSMSWALQTPKDIVKRARAIENQVYLISANSGGIAGRGFPRHRRTACRKSSISMVAC